ncbi:MAG: glycosyltransferase family 4 protein [Bdellovibrionota bacterium]
MRIGIVMNFLAPWARTIVKTIKELDHSVHVIGFKPVKNPESYLDAENPMQVKDLKKFFDSVDSVNFLHERFKSNFDYLLNAPKLKKIAKKANLDVLLCLYGGGFSTMAYLSRFRPYAVYLVGSDILLASKTLRKLNKLSLATAVVNFTNGKELAKQTLRQVPKAHVENILQGIDLKQFTPLSETKAGFNIICNRGFLEVYNNQVILDALADSPEILDKASVQFLAGGPLLNKAKEYVRMNISAKVQEKISFLNGVPHSSMPEFLKQSDIFISMSKSDGTATSLLEALATGLFPIVSDIPANQDWINNGENGILVPIDDPSLLAKAIQEALTNSQLRDKASEKNRKLVEDRASITKNMRELMRMLEDAIS